MKKIIIVSLLLCVTSYSCNMNQIAKPLPGKIAVTNSFADFRIYEDSDTPNYTFKMRDKDDVYNGMLRWLNKQDSFVGNKADHKEDIAIFDLKGNIVGRLYEAKQGDTTGSPYPSRNDKYVLFTLDKDTLYQKNVARGPARMNSIIVMDMKKRQVIKIFNDVGKSPNLVIDESPWLFDETRFVYSYTKYQDDNVLDSNGIYICDIVTGQRKLLIPHAYSAICSPTSLQIAYLKNASIWLMDLATNKQTILFNGTNTRICNIHWTPDGKAIFFAALPYILTPGLFNEELIDIGTQDSIPFKRINFHLYSYTWK